MPGAIVRGVCINYEVISNSGLWIAFTPGSCRPYGELVDLSKAIAAFGYRVRPHDRLKLRRSDAAFEGSASKCEVWGDDNCSTDVYWESKAGAATHPRDGQA